MFEKCHRSVVLGIRLACVGDGKRFTCLVDTLNTLSFKVFHMLIYSSSDDNQAPTASLFCSTFLYLFFAKVEGRNTLKDSYHCVRGHTRMIKAPRPRDFDHKAT